MTTYVNPNKAAESASINDAVAAYLANGGTITRVPSGPQPARRTKQ